MDSCHTYQSQYALLSYQNDLICSCIFLLFFSLDNFQQQVLQKLQKLEDVQAQIVDMLANLAKSSATTRVGPADLQEPLLEPVKTMQEFDVLEMRLAESDFKKRMVSLKILAY